MSADVLGMLNPERENTPANIPSIASAGRRDARAQRGVCLAIRDRVTSGHSVIGAPALDAVPVSGSRSLSG
jgi:hypothetical protein